MPRRTDADRALILRVLGEMELARGGEVLPLPPSKKSRTLLAYLVISGQRRTI
jgi:DNA-binding SARP family transcriptional activator